MSVYGEVHEGLGEPAPALDYYDRAIQVLETRRSLLSRDETKTALAGESGARHLYFNAMRAALQLQGLQELETQAVRCDNQKQPDSYARRAFEYAERGKARALLDLIAAGPSTLDKPLVYASRQLSAQVILWHSLLAQERGRSEPNPNRITQLQQHVERSEEELRRMEAELAASATNLLQAQVASLDQVKNLLPAGTALLQYLFLGDDLLGWAITRQGMVKAHHAAVDARALGGQMRALHRACADQQDGEEYGRQLAAILLSPLAEVIRDNTHLIFVPYGPAHILPFHALPWEGQSLAATHAISYLPSASVLQFLHQEFSHAESPRGVPDHILAVGNPAHMAYQPRLGQPPMMLSDLPAAATEAAFVASLFPQGQVLLGSQATESAVRKQMLHSPLLHFATHGYLSQEAPLDSAILLADGEALSLYELMGQRLQADLVVLSACDTARGEATGGDEVLGLTRGLLAAGARAAVVSLWPVNDVSTSLLMGEFYRCLRHGTSYAIALQTAQNYVRGLTPQQITVELERLRLAMQTAGAEDAALRPIQTTQASRHAGPAGMATRSDDYRHPFYWAPFVLVG